MAATDVSLIYFSFSIVTVLKSVNVGYGYQDSVFIILAYIHIGFGLVYLRHDNSEIGNTMINKLRMFMMVLETYPRTGYVIIKNTRQRKVSRW